MLASGAVTVIVTAAKLLESVGENAEEAGEADHCRWCLNGW
jgi:hypothetical protein